MTGGESRYSQRAIEEAEDILDAVERSLAKEGVSTSGIMFRLDGTEGLLNRAEAEVWIKQSVDLGYARVGYVLEHTDALGAVVNLAAYEDPDSQYHP